MHEGEIKLTSLQRQQQDRGREKMSMYWKNAAPALSVSLRSLKDQGVLQEQTAGANEQSARVATDRAQRVEAARSYDTGAGPAGGGGAFASRQAGILTRGAGVGGESGAVSKLGVVGSDNAKRANIVGAGNRIVEQSDKALDTAAKIQAGLYQKAVENRQADEEAFAEIGGQLEGMTSGMGGGGGGGGGMGGMGGGG